MKLHPLLLLSVLICCGSIKQTRTFKHSHHNYEFTYPGTWTVKDWGQLSVEVDAPVDYQQENERVLLAVNVAETAGLDIDQCFETYVNQWYEEQNRGLAKENGSAVVNGRKAKWVEYSFEEGGIPMTNLVYLVYCDDRFVLLSATCSTEKYPEYKSKFVTIVDSFTIASTDDK